MTEKDAIEVMPRVQSLHAQLYDSPLDSMLWRLQDANTNPNPNPNPNPNANPNPNPNPGLNLSPNPDQATLEEAALDRSAAGAALDRSEVGAGVCSARCVRACLQSCSAVFHDQGLQQSEQCYTRCTAGCLPKCLVDSGMLGLTES